MNHLLTRGTFQGDRTAKDPLLQIKLEDKHSGLLTLSVKLISFSSDDKNHPQDSTSSTVLVAPKNVSTQHVHRSHAAPDTQQIMLKI